MAEHIHIFTPSGELNLTEVPTFLKSKFIDKKKAKLRVKKEIDKMFELQETLFAGKKRALLIIFQGMDTSGKDSMIKHVMQGINPQGCNVHSFKAPSSEELAHDYIWRCAKVVPAKGNIGIFNRSYYEDVTITRVHNALLEKEHVPKKNINGKLWEKRFEEINNYEKYLTQNGTTILKFFLHISDAEQKSRILRRIEDPQKHWKFDNSDIREREFWDDYQNAYEKALVKTNTKWSPWSIVPSDDKWTSRVIVSNAIVKALVDMNLKMPTLTQHGINDLNRAKDLLKQEKV